MGFEYGEYKEVNTPARETSPLSISPDGKFLMAVSNDQILMWWTETGRLVNVTNTDYYYLSLAVDHDSQTLAISSEGFVDLYDISNLLALLEMEGVPVIELRQLA